MSDLVKHGTSRQGIALLKGWATRRAKYGDNGLSAHAQATYPRIEKGIKYKTHCKRGHKLSPENLTHGRCTACFRIRAGRATWDALQRQKAARLRAAMIAAHPDKGGSAARFIRAKAKLDAFLRRAA